MAPYPSLTYIVNVGQVKIVAILNKADLPDGGGDLVLGPDCIEITPEPAIDSETAIAVSVVAVEGEPGVISVVTDEAAALVKRTRQWAAIRVERNVRLAASDFTQLPDIQVKMTAEDKVAWVTYRQALRDFPTGETDPNAPVWPVAPGVIGVVVTPVEVVVPVVVEPEVVVPVEPEVVVPVEPVAEAPVAPEEPVVVVPVAPEEPVVVAPVAPEEPVPEVVVTPVEPEVV